MLLNTLQYTIIIFANREILIKQRSFLYHTYTDSHKQTKVINIILGVTIGRMNVMAQRGPILNIDLGKIKQNIVCCAPKTVSKFKDLNSYRFFTDFYFHFNQIHDCKCISVTTVTN